MARKTKTPDKSKMINVCYYGPYNYYRSPDGQFWIDQEYQSGVSYEDGLHKENDSELVAELLSDEQTGLYHDTLDYLAMDPRLVTPVYLPTALMKTVAEHAEREDQTIIEWLLSAIRMSVEIEDEFAAEQEAEAKDPK